MIDSASHRAADPSQPHFFERRVPAIDGEQLAVLGWESPGARAALLVTTGFSEYAARYEPLARFLGERGYSTYAYDARGHGRSSGPRGHSPSWRRLLEDLDRVVAALRQEGRLAERLGLLGTSMGGLLALDWALARPDQVRGLVLVAPFFEPAFQPSPWRVALARLVAPIVPTLSQRHPLTGRDLSRDAAIVAAYDRDPNINRVMSARYYVEFRAAEKRLAASGPQVRFPVLVLQGGSDPVESPEATARWVRSVPSPWVEEKLYPALKHEVLNELERPQVYSDLAGWLDRTLRQG